MENWDIFWYTIAFIGVVGAIAAAMTPKVNQAMEKLEHLANGHVTKHHEYIPFD